MASYSAKGDKSEHLIWKMFNFLFNWAPRFRTNRYAATKEGTLPMAVNTVHLQDQADLLRRGMADLHAED
ncbi:MAG TPA: hypothetical protein DCE36_03480, partial [Pseudomonas sp.]|nr:hypothetical protein [Pseudomonas sp.]